MEILGTLCLIVGAVISLIFGIQLIFIAFQTSILWGLGYLFVPLVSIIFIITHWDEAKTPFLRCLLAIPFFVLGAILSPGSSLLD